MTRKRPRRSERSARRRAAFHADRARRAGTPAEQFKAMQDLLLSNASRAGRRDIERVTSAVEEHARHMSQRAGMREVSRRHNETAVGQASSPSHRLGLALRWLRTAITLLPEQERDAELASYATELRDDARSLERR